MPAFEFSSKYQAWVKQCSCCREEFIGTRDQAESEAIFQKDFAFSNGSAQCADGFQSRCRFCNSHGRRALGVTRSWFKAMLVVQNHQCAICQKSIDERCHVDHDEETNEIRGLLCGPCNQGIGLLRHDPVVLSNAINYLLAFSKRSAA